MVRVYELFNRIVSGTHFKGVSIYRSKGDTEPEQTLLGKDQSNLVSVLLSAEVVINEKDIVTTLPASKIVIGSNIGDSPVKEHELWDFYHAYQEKIE